jgi:hypothetical protein
VVPRALAAFLRLGANYIAHFIAGLRRVQHTDHRSDTEPRQEPQEAIAITIRHNLPPQFLCTSNGSTLICENTIHAARALPAQLREGFPQQGCCGGNKKWHQRSSCAGRAKGGE